MGWSMGGQYAAAVGHALRHRVTRVAIVAGALPLTESGVFDQLPAMDRYLTRMSQRAPWLAQQWFRIMGFAPRVAPVLYGRLAARDLGPADGAVIRGEGFRTFAQMSREAMRQPAGVVEEYRAWMRPWGFAPEDLDVPVDIWAGTDDQLVDPSWPHRLASRIPNATLNIRDGGHFVAHLHYREIFDSLRSGWRALADGRGHPPRYRRRNPHAGAAVVRTVPPGATPIAVIIVVPVIPVGLVVFPRHSG